jgi:ABC-2 type transport system ATP-binding protein
VEIRDLIKDIGRERTVILSTHNLAEVQVACNRVLIISKGRIVADDTPVGLRDRAGKSRCLITLLKQSADGFTKGVESALSNLPGVEWARRIDSSVEGELSLEVMPRGGEDLRPALFKAAVDQGYTLVGLQRESQNLEQVFRELTTGAASAEPPTAKAAA